MADSVRPLIPGQKVSVTQQIHHGDGVWSYCLCGRVIKHEQRKTGSWYAHAKDRKLWLDRLTLRKDDGEIVVCILDPSTQVVILDHPASPQATDDQAKPNPDANHDNSEEAHAA